MKRLIFKYGYFIFALRLFTSCNINEKTDCNSVHTGDFYFKGTFSQRTFLMQRNDSIQTEIDTSQHKVITKRVEWINDCEYTLTIMNDVAKVDTAVDGKVRVYEFKNRQQRISIIEVAKKYYVFESLSAKGRKYTDTVWIRRLVGGFVPISGKSSGQN